MELEFQNNFNRNNNVTLKSAKAVCILVPIFGLHFLLMPMRPEHGSHLEYAYEVRLNAYNYVIINIIFLAPSGAQKVKISVRLSLQ